MKLRKKTGLAAGVIAGVTMLVAPAAFATNTLSVDGTTSPAADVVVNGTQKSATLAMVTDFGTQASCSVSSVAGTVRRGASVTVGQTIGKVTNLTFGSAGTPCIATSLSEPVVITKTPGGTKGLPNPYNWSIVVTATPAKGAATVAVQIQGIDVKMRSVAKSGSPSTYLCDLRARGTVTGTFNQTNQQLTINPPAGTYPLNNIEAYDGNGTNTASPLSPPRTCAGQIYTGDSARMTGSFTLATPGVGGIHW